MFWFWISFIQFFILGFLVVSKSEVSVEKALRYLKKDLVRMIVFYQGQYSEDDQIVLIKKWLDSFDKKKVNRGQLDLFKEYVKEI